MKKIQKFQNKEFGEIRAVEIDGQGWLVGKDVVEKLKYRNGSRDINRHVDQDDRQLKKIHDGRQNRDMILINESGLYALVLGSELPSAKKFKNWVTKEVLPSIRKHGAYMTPEIIEKTLTDPDFIIGLATQLKEERKERELLQQQSEKNKPKVLFAEAVENSEDVIFVKEMALIITQHGFKIGQNQLFQYLRDNEYLCKKHGGMYHLPTKKYEHLFKVTKRNIQSSDGTIVKNTPKVTGKGQMHFIKKFNSYKEEGLTIKDLLTKESA